MFSRKPPPPHCENLTAAQVKLVRKILSDSYYYKQRAHAETAAEHGWNEVFVAVAQQTNFPAGEDYKSTFLAKMIEVLPPDTVADIFPLVCGLSDTRHGDLLAAAIAKRGQRRLDDLVQQPTTKKTKSCALYALAGYTEVTEAMIEAFSGLIAAGADVHYEAGGTLKRALIGEHWDLVSVIVDAGFDFTVYGEAVRAHLIENKASHAAIKRFDEIAGTGRTATPSFTAPDTQDEYLRSGDSVSRTDRIAGGGSLTTVFNFATRQQIVIAHVAGQTTAPVITPFSQIEGDAGLLLAAEAFVLQGGAAALAEPVVLHNSRANMRIEKGASTPAKLPAR